MTRDEEIERLSKQRKEAEEMTEENNNPVVYSNETEQERLEAQQRREEKQRADKEEQGQLAQSVLKDLENMIQALEEVEGVDTQIVTACVKAAHESIADVFNLGQGEGPQARTLGQQDPENQEEEAETLARPQIFENETSTPYNSILQDAAFQEAERRQKQKEEFQTKTAAEAVEDDESEILKNIMEIPGADPNGPQTSKLIEALNATEKPHDIEELKKQWERQASHAYNYGELEEEVEEKPAPKPAKEKPAPKKPKAKAPDTKEPVKKTESEKEKVEKAPAKKTTKKNKKAAPVEPGPIETATTGGSNPTVTAPATTQPGTTGSGTGPSTSNTVSSEPGNPQRG